MIITYLRITLKPIVVDGRPLLWQWRFVVSVVSSNAR